MPAAENEAIARDCLSIYRTQATFFLRCDQMYDFRHTETRKASYL